MKSFMGSQHLLNLMDASFHGCMECYRENDCKPLAGATFGYLYYTAQQKMDHLKRVAFNIGSISEHEWLAMTKSDGKLSEFLAKTKLPMPLVPRDALFGSRTNVIFCITKQPLMKRYKRFH